MYNGSTSSTVYMNVATLATGSNITKTGYSNGTWIFHDDTRNGVYWLYGYTYTAPPPAPPASTTKYLTCFNSYELYTNNTISGVNYTLLNGTYNNYNQSNIMAGQDGTSSTTGKAGVYVNSTSNIRINNITLHASESGSTVAYIKRGYGDAYFNGVLIASTTNRSGDTYIFNGGVILNANTTYSISIDDAGDTYTRVNDVNPAADITGTHLKIIRTETTENFYNINEIKYGVPTGDYTLNGSCANISNGTYSLMAESDDHFSKSLNFNVSGINKTHNITGFYDLLLNLILKDISNTTLTVNSVVNLTSPIINNTYNIIGNYYFNLLTGRNYSFISLPTNYSYANASYYTTVAKTEHNLLITHYTINSVALYFYDELTYDLITPDNITMEFISDDFSYTYYTTTGSKLVSLLSPAEYNIRFKADTYTPRNYFFTLVNNSYSLLNLTMLPLGEGTNVTINLYDNIGNKIVGARIKILKYIVPTNSYRIVDIRETSFEGKTVVAMQLNTEYYKFIVEFDKDGDGDLDNVLTTAPSYIYDDTINLYANIYATGFNSLFDITGLYGVITYDNTTRKASFTYDDAQGIATQGCIYAYRLLLGERTLVNSTCAVGAAGVALTTIPNVNATYEIRGYITKDTKNIFITQKIVKLGGTNVFNNPDSLLLSAFIIITFFFLGFFAAEIGVILAGLATMLLSFVGLLPIPASVTVPIFVLSLIIAFVISKNRGGG